MEEKILPSRDADGLSSRCSEGQRDVAGLWIVAIRCTAEKQLSEIEKPNRGEMGA